MMENFLRPYIKRRPTSWSQHLALAEFAANNDLALVLAACLDGGILYSPRLLIESEIRLGRLEVITLSDAAGQDVGAFAVYPQAKPPAKVRVFVEFIDECLKRLADTDRGAPLLRPAS